MDKLPLRERKKIRTRRALMDVSSRLFLRQGFEATTLEQICDKAEISVKTLFRYFKSKEHLALAGEYENLERFREEILSPEREGDTLAFWRNHVAARSFDRDAVMTRHRFIISVPSLLARWLAISVEYQNLLAESIARDRGVLPENDLHSTLLAAMLVGGNNAMYRRWIGGGGAGDLAATCLSVVDFAIEDFPVPAGSGSVSSSV